MGMDYYIGCDKCRKKMYVFSRKAMGNVNTNFNKESIDFIMEHAHCKPRESSYRKGGCFFSDQDDRNDDYDHITKRST